jgi:leader peptidase (prepilin peptidase) / N-methyltransferase
VTHGALIVAGMGAIAGLAAAPYLAGLTVTTPDRAVRRWWRREPVPTRRRAVTAVVAGVLGALSGAAAGWSTVLPAFLALAAVTAPLVIIDVERHRLPDRLVATGAVAAALLLSAAAVTRHDAGALLRSTEAAAVVVAVLVAFALASPRSFGLGDVKLGGLLGAYLGWLGWTYVSYGIFAGFLLGALLALPLVATGRATLRSPVPFGPPLVAGALIVAAFGLVGV